MRLDHQSSSSGSLTNETGFLDLICPRNLPGRWFLSFIRTFLIKLDIINDLLSIFGPIFLRNSRQNWFQFVGNFFLNLRMLDRRVFKVTPNILDKMRRKFIGIFLDKSQHEAIHAFDDKTAIFQDKITSLILRMNCNHGN